MTYRVYSTADWDRDRKEADIEHQEQVEKFIEKMVLKFNKEAQALAKTPKSDKEFLFDVPYSTYETASELRKRLQVSGWEVSEPVQSRQAYFIKVKRP